MSKYRQAAKCDSNQTEIVKCLRKAGCLVQLGHDDILVDCRDNITRQFEIKSKPIWNKNGTLRKGVIKDSQYKILWESCGNYYIIENSDQALYTAGFLIEKNKDIEYRILNPIFFRKNYKKLLSEKELNRLCIENIIKLE